MAVPVIYLSAAQADLRTHRMAARAILEAEGLQVVDYEIRDATGWSPVRHGMRACIRKCDAVVHLAGISFGAEPNAVPDGAVRRSFAQMEYHLASDLHIPCYSIVLAEDFPFDAHKPDDGEAQRLQQQHRAALTQGMSCMDTVHDPGDLQWSLEALAGRIRMSHAAPRQKTKALASWLLFTPVTIIALLALAYLAGIYVNIKLQAPIQAQTETTRPENSAAMDSASMARARQMIAEVAAAAVTAGLPAEQQDPHTKVELAVEEVAGRHGLSPLDTQLEMQRFVTAVDATPGSDIMDKVYAAFVEGKYAKAAELASLIAEETDTDDASGQADAPTALLQKGHFQWLASQYPAALASYKAGLAGIDRSQAPHEWSEAALTASVVMTQLTQWDEASILLADLLDYFDKQPSPDPRAHALALRTMASLQIAKGQPGKAEALLLQSCKLLDADPGKNQDDLAMSFVALGEALCFAGKRDGAEDAFRRAVVLQEQAHGPDSSQAARMLGSLATMLADSGRQAHAVGLCERALAIDEKRFGPTHPRVARDLMRLAAISFRRQKGGNREVDLCRRAFETCWTAFGAKHPGTASAMTSLATVLAEQPPDRAEAESLARDAWSIDTSALGEEHPATLRDMKTLAGILKVTGNKDQALDLHRRVLAITEKKYGPENPETARAMGDLAQALGENGRYADAEPLLRRALAIYERQFGPDDFRVFLGVRTLAGVLRDSGNKEAALEHFRRALDIARRNLPPDDPGLFAELGNVGSALRSVGRYSDAEAFFREALAMQEKSMPPGEPAVAETLSNLAGVLFLSGRHSEAEPVYRRVLEVLASVSKENKQPHPNLELARKNYQADLQRMGLSDDEIARRIEKVEAGEAVKDLTAASVR